MWIRLSLILLALAVLLTSHSATLAQTANIGSVTQLKGPSEVVRKARKIPTQPRLSVQQMDNVRTGNGRIEITFADNTKVKLTEQSRLVIDDFVYDANPAKRKMALKFASGTARFVTGSMGKKGINLKTPTATVAVRGTDFTTTVDEMGKSLFILLPDENGDIGEITVSNSAGTVILNKAFQSTMVLTADSPPTKPVILSLDLNMIDNMLIVTPPEVVQEQDMVDKRANILDLSELDIDFLKNDDLEKNDINNDDLSINRLDIDFFDDDLVYSEGRENSKDGVRLVGTNFGLDNTTKIYTFVEQVTIQFTRIQNNTASILTEKTSNLNISFTDNGRTNIIQLNDGGSNIIVSQQN
jgi:hypothetical protein